MTRSLSSLLLCSLVGCASTPAPATAAPPVPSRAATRPLEQLNDTEDLVELALLASGYEDSTRRARARATLETKLAEITRPLASVKDETERGRRLLRALHLKGGLLGTYSARATSLADVLERRHYNCVSASVLYNLAAHRLDLTVGAQLLPTHARSLMSLRSQQGLRRVVVETTAGRGFDPTAKEQAAILAQVAGPPVDGARGLVSSSGKVVGTRVLIGTIFVNRGSIVQESGDLEQAAQLFARGEAIAKDPQMRQVLRDQRAALLSQLASDDLLSGSPELLERAVSTLLAARRIKAEDAAISNAIGQNLRAAGERLIEVRAKRGEKQVLAEAERLKSHMPETLRGGFLAFAWSAVSGIRFNDNQPEAAVAAMEQALKFKLSPRDRALKAVLQANHVSALRVAALERARGGDWKRALAHLNKMKSLPGADPAFYQEDLLRSAHLVGNYRVEARDYVGAAELYRWVLTRYPDDRPARHNLVAVLQRQIRPLAESGGCQQARVLLDELDRWDTKSVFSRSVRIRCLLDEGRRAVDNKAYEAAADAIGQAAKLAPTDKVVQQNLAVSLYAWLKDLVGRRDCARAKQVARDLAQVPGKHIKRAQRQALLARCSP